MTTLYIRLDNKEIINITDSKRGYEKMYLGVKYIFGKDVVTFTEDNNGFIVVDRHRGLDRLYRHVFREDGSFMLTSLFVTEYKVNGQNYKSIYNFLKKNFDGRFLLEVDNHIEEPFSIAYRSWVDIAFNYKFSISINEKMITKDTLEELKTCLLCMKDFDLVELHKLIGPQAIRLDMNTVKKLRTLPKVYNTIAW